MYYYYYYYGPDTRKVTLRIQTVPNIKRTSLHELNAFLEALLELHKAVVYTTQPEYSSKHQKCKLAEVQLLHYHELEIKSITTNSPLIIEVTFSLLGFSQNPYWALWKLLIAICKRYGRTHENVLDSYHNIRIVLDPIVSNLMQLKSKLPMDDDHIGVNVRSKKESIEFLNDSLNKLMTDPGFVKYYNIICDSIFKIDSVLTICNWFELEEYLIKDGAGLENQTT